VKACVRLAHLPLVGLEPSVQNGNVRPGLMQLLQVVLGVVGVLGRALLDLGWAVVDVGHPVDDDFLAGGQALVAGAHRIDLADRPLEELGGPLGCGAEPRWSALARERRALGGAARGGGLTSREARALSVALEGGRAAPFHSSFMLETARHTVPQTNRRHEAQTAGARLQADGGLELPGGLLPCRVRRGRHQAREDQREHAQRGALLGRRLRQDRPVLPCSRAR